MRSLHIDVPRAAALIAAALMAAGAAAPAYRDGPPSAHTGGFGEAHCGACHFDAPVDDAVGAATIEAPTRYQPGTVYDVVITVQHPDLAAAGFQLAARFATGPSAGRQAGGLEAIDPRAHVVHAPSGIAYASHTEAGANPAERGVGRWVVRWTAPPSRDDVVFHLAANAADGDGSEFGDHLYLAEHRARR